METLKVKGQREGESLEEAITRLLKEGKEVTHPHVTKEGIEDLYAFAYGFYESGHYEKSMHFFRFLTLVDFENRKHWMGLGAAYQMLKQYERALQCYAQAALLNPNEPYAHWHAAECFLALNLKVEAEYAMTSAHTLAISNPERYRPLLDKIELMKMALKKTKKVIKKKNIKIKV